MKRKLRLVFWMEGLAAIAAGLSLVLTLLWRDWIEIIFHIDPDNSSGFVEWSIVLLSLTATIFFGFLANREWHRSTASEARS
jgi:hypothetical protein